VWAAGGAPSKDTFWTSDNGNQSTTRGGCDKSGCPPDHSAAGAELHTMLALLSTGPMGFSDAPGETDPALLARACDSNGTLLQVREGPCCWPAPATRTGHCRAHRPPLSSVGVLSSDHGFTAAPHHSSAPPPPPLLRSPLVPSLPSTPRTT
jgi:hypothetical protein